MQIQKETELSKLLSDNPSGLFLLWGSEDYLITLWRGRILKPFDEAGGFNLQRLDGQQMDINEIYDATQQLPLFAPQKCVVVDDVDPKKLVAAELKKLEQVFADLPPETLLVLVFRGNVLDGKSASGKKIQALADTHGTAAELSGRDTAGLTRFLQGTTKDLGCEISPALCKELIRMCGKDMAILVKELEKACAFAGTGELEMRHLQAVVTPSTEERVFDLGKMILARNGQRAMEIVGNLLYMRENPVAIVATLVMSYVDLYRAKLGQEQGAAVAELVTKFGYKGREFRLRGAMDTTISKQAVQESLDLIYRCDMGLKGSPQDSGELLERTVLQLLAVRDS